MRLLLIRKGEVLPVEVELDGERADRGNGLEASISVVSVTLDGDELAVTPSERDVLAQKAWDVLTDERRRSSSGSRVLEWTARLEEYRMAISERRLEALLEWPTIADVPQLVNEIRSQRELLKAVRPSIGDLALLEQVDAAIRGEIVGRR